MAGESVVGRGGEEGLWLIRVLPRGFGEYDRGERSVLPGPGLGLGRVNLVGWYSIQKYSTKSILFLVRRLEFLGGVLCGSFLPVGGLRGEGRGRGRVRRCCCPGDGLW